MGGYTDCHLLHRDSICSAFCWPLAQVLQVMVLLHPHRLYTAGHRAACETTPPAAERATACRTTEPGEHRQQQQPETKSHMSPETPYQSSIHTQTGQMYLFSSHTRRESDKLQLTNKPTNQLLSGLTEKIISWLSIVVLGLDSDLR